MHVGLLRFSALGDVVLWSALLEQCQRRYPQVSLTWITSPQWPALFPGLTQVRWLRAQKPRSFKDYRQLRHMFKGECFDALLCGQASLRANLVYPLIRAKDKIGFDQQRGREGHGWFCTRTIEYRDNHLIEGFAQFFEAAGLPLDLQDLRWPLAPSPEAKAFARTALHHHYPSDHDHSGSLIGLVLSASKTERTWPLSKQIELISLLIARSDARIVLIGGSTPTEQALAKSIGEKFAQHPAAQNRLIDLVGQTNLTNLCGILQAIDCLISPDTGPAHLAHGLGTPVIGLYAVARAALSGPYQSPYTIDAYTDAAKHCGFGPAKALNWHKRIHHPEAMTVITPERVFQVTEQVLADTG